MRPARSAGLRAVVTRREALRRLIVPIVAPIVAPALLSLVVSDDLLQRAVAAPSQIRPSTAHAAAPQELHAAARPISDRSSYQSGRSGSLTHGPLLGAVTDTSVKVWARGDGRGVLQAELKPADEAWPGAVIGEAQLDAGHDLVGVIDVTGLAPSTDYEYRLIFNGAETGGGGTFRTLPPAGQPGAFRFSLGGDLSATHAPFTILDHLRVRRPDFNLLLGDLIYADHPTLIPESVEVYREKYRDNWGDPSFRGLTRDVPSFMIWDDHEIGNDFDAGKTGRYLPARAAFDEYVANHNPAPVRAGQLYYTFAVADVELFVLDVRSYRSPRALPSGSAKSMLGAEQKRDLQNWLAASRAPFKVILSAVPLHDFGAARPDGWSGFASERAEILEFVRQRGIEGVVVLSGDQHWCCLVNHDPYGIWEFNATPLAQGVHERPPTDDPRLVMAYAASPAFGIVDVDTRGSAPRMTFSVVDAAGQTRSSFAVLPRGLA